MGHRIAEICHAPPDDEAAERAGGDGKPDTGDERVLGVRERLCVCLILAIQTTHGCSQGGL